MNDTPNTDLARMVQGGQAVIRIENESMQQLAIQRPRPGITEILKEATAELEAVPEFAETAFYVLPFKERSDDPNAKVVNIEGLSIKAAQALRRHFRNIASATRTVDETERDVVVQGVAMDLETNTRSAKEKNVSKFQTNKKTKQEYPLRNDRLQMAIDAGKSKAERNAILALLPEALKITYFRKAKEVAAKRLGAGGSKPLPIAERRELAIRKFGELGVTEEILLRHLKLTAREQMTDDHIGILVGIFNSISDNEMAIEEAFGLAKPAQEKPTVGEDLLQGMMDTAGTGLPDDGSTATVDSHAPLTSIEREEQEEIKKRLDLRLAFDKKMKALSPRYPDALTPGETKFLQQALFACWGVQDLQAIFDLEPMGKLQIGMDRWDILADGILARRAK